MLSHKISHLPQELVTLRQASGVCVAARARVDHGCVWARAVAKRKPSLGAAWRGMADTSNVRHDTIVVPETMSPADVRAVAERKAQAQVGVDAMAAFLYLHGSRSVGGEHGTEVEWRYSYQVIPPTQPHDGGGSGSTNAERSPHSPG